MTWQRRMCAGASRVGGPQTSGASLAAGERVVSRARSLAWGSRRKRKARGGPGASGGSRRRRVRTGPHAYGRHQISSRQHRWQRQTSRSSWHDVSPTRALLMTTRSLSGSWGHLSEQLLRPGILRRGLTALTAYARRASSRFWHTKLCHHLRLLFRRPECPVGRWAHARASSARDVQMHR